MLDGLHLYYINAFENAASTIETSSVAAENVARLILSRIGPTSRSAIPTLENTASHEGENLHVEL